MPLTAFLIMGVESIQVKYLGVIPEAHDYPCFDSANTLILSKFL